MVNFQYFANRKDFSFERRDSELKSRIGKVSKEMYDATNWTLRWHRTVRINVVVASRAVGGRRRWLGHRWLLRVALKILLRSTCAVFQRHTLFHRHHRY